MKKKKIVENDKQKIEEVIQELDMKKNDALKKAWEQVNKVIFVCLPKLEVKTIKLYRMLYFHRSRGNRQGSEFFHGK